MGWAFKVEGLYDSTNVTYLVRHERDRRSGDVYEGDGPYRKGRGVSLSHKCTCTCMCVIRETDGSRIVFVE